MFLDNIPSIQAVPHIETWPEIEDVVNALLEEAYYEPTGRGEAGELVVAILDRTKPLFERANSGADAWRCGSTGSGWACGSWPRRS